MNNDELILEKLSGLSIKMEKIEISILGDNNGTYGMKNTLRDINDAVKGDEYGNPGLIKRVKSVEKEQNMIKYVYISVLLALSMVFDEIKTWFLKII